MNETKAQMKRSQMKNGRHVQRSQMKMGWKTQAKILISRYYLTLTI